MNKISFPKYLLTGQELSPEAIRHILEQAKALKKERASHPKRQDLSGRQLALLFDKPSLRTRFSFTIAMRELGGDVIESLGNNRKKEHPEDLARVLEGYCHGIMIRTDDDNILTKMSQACQIPIINGLSDLHHPCQILSDLLTLEERFHTLNGLVLSYIGDGNNILHSLLLLAPQMGIHLRYCCPPSRQPNEFILKQALSQLEKERGSICQFEIPIEAAAQSHAIYTDVWISMGFESAKNDIKVFEGFQVNEALMSHAHEEAIFMHCLPMERGIEVSHTLPDKPCSVIFQQSENRLHAQKALLLNLINQ